MITESAEPHSPQLPGARRRVPWQARLHKRAAIVTRWLHVYLSMLSFAVILFFAVTGLTLNHPDWFANQQRTVVRHGVADPALIKNTPDRLGIVEMLRAREHLRGAVSDFQADESQIQISARAPGYTADTVIDRATGRYDLTEVSSGVIAIMNDLHQGRDAGKAWAYVIDASAILLTLVSLTGLVLLWFVSKRRLAGFLLAAFATVAFFILYRVLVP